MELWFNFKKRVKAYIRREHVYNGGLCGICDQDTQNDYFLRNGTNIKEFSPKFERDWIVGQSWFEPGYGDTL